MIKQAQKGISCLFILLLFLSSCQLGTAPEEIVNNPEQAEINQRMEQAERAFQAKAYAESLQETQAILMLNKDYTPAYVLQVRSYLQQNMLIEAKETLDQLGIVMGTEKDASYYEVRAEYHIKKRQYQEALQFINQAIKLETSNRRLGLKGSIQFYLHQHAEAKQSLEQAVQDETDAERVTYYELLTELAIYEGDVATALRYLTLLKTDKTTSNAVDAMEGYLAYLQRDAATTWMEKEAFQAQGDAAIQQAMTKVQIQPDAVAYNYLGLSAALMGAYDEAYQYYTAAITLDSGYASFYNNRALTLYYQYEYERAYQDVSEAIKRDPLEPEFYLGRGFISMSQGQRNAAIGDFTKAVELDPRYRARIPAEVLDALPQKEKEQQ